MEDKKYSLGEFTFDTQQEYERAKVELQVILKIKQKYDINNPEDAKNVLEVMNNELKHTDFKINEKPRQEWIELIAGWKSKKTKRADTSGSISSSRLFGRRKKQRDL
nr:hypothetical protein [[Ruminococcus] torques]